MPQNIVRSGLIQMSNKVPAEKPCENHREGMLKAHLPFIKKAAAEGVQILCFQEIFTGPYFCPSQDSKWYGLAERIPEEHTTKLMMELAKKNNMVIVVPIYEEEMTGVYYNVFFPDQRFLFFITYLAILNLSSTWSRSTCW
jgi:N-carbamoylputrescine amidase